MPQDTEILAFLKAIRRLSRALDIHSSRINRDVGLTLPQLVVLTCVRDMDEPTGKAIAAAADLSAPTVVGILDKLETKGLVARRRSTRDRRLVRTALTDRGAATLTDAPAPMGETFAANLHRLDLDQRLQLIAALEEIAAMTCEDTVSSDPAITP